MAVPKFSEIAAGDNLESVVTESHSGSLLVSHANFTLYRLMLNAAGEFIPQLPAGLIGSGEKYGF